MCIDFDMLPNRMECIWFLQAQIAVAMMFVMFRMQFDEFLIKCSYDAYNLCIHIFRLNFSAKCKLPRSNICWIKSRKFFDSVLAFGICVRVLYVYIWNDWF